MNCIVFDASPIISMTMNNLLPVVKELRRRFKGNFCITETVKEELVDAPLETKKYKFQALQILKLIRDQTFSVSDEEKFASLRDELLALANNIYSAKGNPIKIVHPGEMASLALALTVAASAYVVDERTTRKLIEEPLVLRNILEQKLHTSIQVNSTNLSEFRRRVKDIKVLRSFELMIICYELGILDDYLSDHKDSRRELLEAVLWGLKLDGCAVSEEEIEGMIVAESRR